eukprot:scaffold76019_cov66-Phaeocystis_antarctica.AAC.10
MFHLRVHCCTCAGSGRCATSPCPPPAQYGPAGSPGRLGTARGHASPYPPCATWRGSRPPSRASPPTPRAGILAFPGAARSPLSGAAGRRRRRLVLGLSTEQSVDLGAIHQAVLQLLLRCHLWPGRPLHRHRRLDLDSPLRAALAALAVLPGDEAVRRQARGAVKLWVPLHELAHHLRGPAVERVEGDLADHAALHVTSSTDGVMIGSDSNVPSLASGRDGRCLRIAAYRPPPCLTVVIVTHGLVHGHVASDHVHRCLRRVAALRLRRDVPLDDCA